MVTTDRSLLHHLVLDRAFATLFLDASIPVLFGGLLSA
jgi:hypothetical protein